MSNIIDKGLFKLLESPQGEVALLDSNNNQISPFYASITDLILSTEDETIILAKVKVIPKPDEQSYPYQRLFGVIDLTGKTIIEPSFNYIGSIQNTTYILVYDQNGKCGLFDSRGNPILPTEFNNIVHVTPKTGIVIFDCDERYGVLKLKKRKSKNSSYTIFLEPRYGYYDIHINPELNLIVVNSHPQFFTLDYTGKTKYQLPPHFIAEEYHPDLNLIKFYYETQTDTQPEPSYINGKYGCMDIKGTLILPPIYDDISFSDIELTAYQKDTYQSFDLKGNPLHGLKPLPSST